MSEQARQEAEKRWPPQTDNWNLTNYTYNGVRVFIRDAFVEGAGWQASQPVEVTDEMVEKAAKAIDREAWSSGITWNPDSWMTADGYRSLRQSEARAAARRALETALDVRQW